VLDRGVDAADFAAVGDRLDSFAGQVFSSFARSDQRAVGGLYLRGLMLDGRRKSMQPMAARLGVDHQRLQQFITDSPWDVVPVRKTLAGLATSVVGADAWVIDDTGHAKDGDSSACVARQYSGTLGKVGNCQVAVSVHAVTDAASAPLDWRLFMPESWDDRLAATAEAAEAVRSRRLKCRIPTTERHRRKWQLALDMLDELRRWGHRPPVVVADAGYGDATAFRLGLEERGLGYVMAIKSTTSAYPASAEPATAPYTGRGRPPTPRYLDPPGNCKDIVIAAGRRRLRQVTWRRGTKTSPGNPTAAMRSTFTAIRIRPANRDIGRADDGTLPERWLIAEWPPGKAEPTDYWTSDLPADTPIATLVRLAKIRWRIEHDYRELKTGVGLDHFEGRSWTGWHHHATIATAAHIFLTRLRLTRPKEHGQA
jgi:SRSO17 transposase